MKNTTKSITHFLLAAGLALGLTVSAFAADANKMSDAEFSKLAASHANAAEHTKLANYYTAHAIEHENDAKLHDTLAAQYEKSEPKLAKEAKHYAEHSREAAEALRNLAAIHKDLAAEHAKKK
jgi:hypothetical protein